MKSNVNSSVIRSLLGIACIVFAFAKRRKCYAKFRCDLVSCWKCRFCSAFQFVNRAYEKVLGYSSTEISGSSFLELQYKHHQLQQQQSQVAYQDQQQQQQGYNLCNSTVTNAQPNQQSRPETANSPTNPAGGGILSESTKSQSPNVQLLSPPAPFHDHVLEELSQGKDWEGNYMYNRKMGDPIFLNSRVLPFSLRHQYSDCSSDHLGTK